MPAFLFMVLGVCVVVAGVTWAAHWVYFTLVPLEWAVRDFAGGITVTVVAFVVFFVTTLIATDHQ